MEILIFILILIEIVAAVFLYTRIVEDYIKKGMKAKKENNEPCSVEINIDDSENDELVAVITAAITAIISSETVKKPIKTNAINRRAKKEPVIAASNGAPFVIRKIKTR